jgi:hypothetical protein
MVFDILMLVERSHPLAGHLTANPGCWLYQDHTFALFQENECCGDSTETCTIDTDVCLKR